MVPIYLVIDALPPVYDGQEAGLLDTLWSLNRIHIPYNSHPPPLYSPTPSASATKCEHRSKGKGAQRMIFDLAYWLRNQKFEVLNINKEKLHSLFS